MAFGEFWLLCHVVSFPLHQSVITLSPPPFRVVTAMTEAGRGGAELEERLSSINKNSAKEFQHVFLIQLLLGFYS